MDLGKERPTARVGPLAFFCSALPGQEGPLRGHPHRDRPVQECYGPDQHRPSLLQSAGVAVAQSPQESTLETGQVSIDRSRSVSEASTGSPWGRARGKRGTGIRASEDRKDRLGWFMVPGPRHNPSATCCQSRLPQPPRTNGIGVDQVPSSRQVPQVPRGSGQIRGPLWKAWVRVPARMATRPTLDSNS